MKGDFTRDTYDPAKHYSRVLMQQGRVTLDADHNEQTAILLHYIRTLARDLIGPYAAPSEDPGFLLRYDLTNRDLIIGAGRYYVDGILVENDEDCAYSEQPDWPLPPNDPLAGEIKSQAGNVFWAYLDVWERHITYIEDDEIREKALNGPDTCTRAQVVWQVKALAVPGTRDPTRTDADTCAGPLGGLVSVSQALLAARIDPGQKVTDACITPPDSKYRGTENQLYRVEIHTSGTASTPATFKWSRDNGSVASAWLGIPAGSANDLLVVHGRGFEPGNWVELSDDTMELQGLPGMLVKLTKVQGNTLSIDPTTVPSAGLGWSDQLINPKVRRWDQTGNEDTQLLRGAVPIQEMTATGDYWIDLEDGVQIEFSPGGQYRTGDYWLIPARVATGSIEWPPETDASGQPVTDADGNVVPLALPPDGIEHHYAPLAFLSLQNDNFRFGSCRCTFDPASSCFRPGSLPAGAHLIRPLNLDAWVLSEDAVERSRTAAQVKRRTKK